MKKRILSLLMAFVMVVSLLPASVRAAETVREISSAKEFAKMDANGSYKLTQGIEVTTPYKSTFNGTFDGDGHTVTLKLNVTSGNAGLFATTGQDAVIKNVEVSADVTSNVASQLRHRRSGRQGLRRYHNHKLRRDRNSVQHRDNHSLCCPHRQSRWLLWRSTNLK